MNQGILPKLLTLVLLASAASSMAADFIVDSVGIRKSPLKAPYYMYFEVSYKDKTAAMGKPYKMSDPAMEGDEVKVSLNLKLADVPMREWATVTIRIDPDPEKVMTAGAAYAHSEVIAMLANATKPKVIMPNMGKAEYVVRAHGEE